MRPGMRASLRASTMIMAGRPVRNSGAVRGSSAPGSGTCGEQIAGRFGMIRTTAVPGDDYWTGLICALEASASTGPPPWLQGQRTAWLHDARMNQVRIDAPEPSAPHGPL
jgi:hypothetical protein